ncbi:hypothetical protein JCM3765_007153 [Sporobolomyces pararoseus]
MPHSRSLSDDSVSFIPPTLSVSFNQSQSPSYSHSAPPTNSSHYPFSSTNSLQPLSAPSTTTPFSSQYTYHSASLPYNTASEFRDQSAAVSDISSHDLGSSHEYKGIPKEAGHKRALVIQGEEEEHEEEKGVKEGEIVYQEEEEGDSAQDWYARTFGVTSAMSLDYQRDGTGEDAGGKGKQDSSKFEQARQEEFSFTFHQTSPTLSTSEYEPPDLSPLSGGVVEGTTSPFDWFSPSTSSSDPPRATYGNDSSSLSPDSPPRSFSLFSSSASTADAHPFRRSSFLPSFGFNSFSTAASASLSQPSLSSSSLAANLPGHYFVPAPTAIENTAGPDKTLSPRRQSETNSTSQSPFLQPQEPTRGGSIDEPGSPPRASTHGFLFTPPTPAIDNRKLSYPSPAQLGPVISPQLHSLPCPSPNFELDDPDSVPPPQASTNPSRFQLSPPFKTSLVDLPPLPPSRIMQLPAPPKFNDLLQAATKSPVDFSPPPPPPSQSKKRTKKHRSTSPSSSSSSSGSSYQPDISEVVSTGVVEPTKENAFQEEEEGAVKISPITGKPTKSISKRSWPPKDAASRRYFCNVSDCGKSFGRPSALATHQRTHDGLKPFNCPVPTCARPFSVFSNLKRHMVVHPSVDFTAVTVNDLSSIKWIVDELDAGGEGGRLVWIDD